MECSYIPHAIPFSPSVQLTLSYNLQEPRSCFWIRMVFNIDSCISKCLKQLVKQHKLLVAECTEWYMHVTTSVRAIMTHPSVVHQCLHEDAISIRCSSKVRSHWCIHELSSTIIERTIRLNCTHRSISETFPTITD